MLSQFNEESYLSVKKNVSFFLYPDNSIKVYIKKGSIKKNKTLTLKQEGWEVIKRINGKKNTRSLYDEIKTDYNLEYPSFVNFLKNCIEKEILDFSDYPHSISTKIIGDGKSYFPSRVNIEITDKCNLKCEYCYVSSSPYNKNVMKYEKVVELFDILEKNGVNTIQLTGGEPLIHPDIDKILNLATTKFDVIALLSNGVYFPDKVMKIIECNPDKIAVQISIDGSNEDINFKVRQVKNSFNKTIQTLEKLLSINAILRVVVVITPNNALDVDDCCRMLRELGIKEIGLSIAEESGAAGMIEYPNKQIQGLYHYIKSTYGEYFLEVNKKYYDIISSVKNITEIGIEETPRNCGAGYRSVAIDPNGNVKPCLLVSDKVKFIGNIFNDNYLHMFNESDVSKVYRKFNFSSLEETECNDCDYKYYCGSCLSKIFFANVKRKSDKKDLCFYAKYLEMDKVFDFS
jgi:radical SAM protein with 4Fe4S-binding SPASM domain